MIERRARWERALACTRNEVLLGAYIAVILLGLGIALRLRVSTAWVVLGGLVAGLAVHACNRLALSEPLLLRRIDWETDPDPASPGRSSLAAFLVVVLTVAPIAVVYFSTGKNWTALIAFFGGSFLAYTLLALLQHVYLGRDFARWFETHGAS